MSVRDALYEVSIKLANLGLDPNDVDLTVRLGLRSWDHLVEELRPMAHYAGMNLDREPKAFLLLCPGGFGIRVEPRR